MSLLSHDELKELVLKRVITNVAPDQINAASIDLTLGKNALVEIRPKFEQRIVKLRDKRSLNMLARSTEEGLLLDPGEFILASTEQVFNLPNDISAEYKLKSSMARIGINHALAGFAEAGWNGSVLTLELMNVTRHHYIELKRGDRMGQMLFFRHAPVPEDKSYAARGRYNGDLGPTQVKK